MSPFSPAALAGAALVTSVFALTGPAAALTDQEAEALFLQYQKAIAAAESCYDLTFNQPQHQAMMDVVNAAVDNRIGTRRLRLVVEAESEVRQMLPSQSCRGERIVPLLELFESDLRPALEGVEG